MGVSKMALHKEVPKSHVLVKYLKYILSWAGLCNTVDNVSDCRYLPDCRSRGCELDPGPVPYFCGD